MAKSKPKPPAPVLELDDDAENDALQDAAAPQPEAIELDEILAELGAAASDARIIVFRIHANADPEECIDCPVTLFSKDRLRADFGPGHYKCEVRKKGVIRKRWSWRFAALANVNAASSSSADRIRELETRIEAEREANRQRDHETMLALLQRPIPPTAPGPSMAELLGVLSQARALLAPGAAGGGIRETLETIRDVMKVKDTLTGDSGRPAGSNLADVVRDALPMLGDMVSIAKAETARAPAPRLAAALAAGEVPGAVLAAAAPPPAPPASSTREAAVLLLLKHAAAETLPRRVAGVLWRELQKLSQDDFDAVCNAIEEPGAVRVALLLEPRLAPHAAYCQALVTELRRQIAAATDPDPLTDAGATAEDAE